MTKKIKKFDRLRVIVDKMKHISCLIPIIMLILLLTLPFALYILAWNEPSEFPTGGDFPIPINIGLESQFKEGKFGVAVSSINQDYDLTVGDSGIKTQGDVYVGRYLKKDGIELAISDIATKNYVDKVIMTLPVGTIAIWPKSYGLIPAGWELADGQDGRPDLRNKFVYGVNDEYGPTSDGDLTTTGGSSAHGHGFSAWVRSYWTGNYTSYESGSNVRCYQGTSCTRLPKVQHRESYDLLCGGGVGKFTNTKKWPYTSNYSGTTQRINDVYFQAGINSSTGGATSLPPYVKLAYIIRVE